jgi:hypothetical protein
MNAASKSQEVSAFWQGHVRAWETSSQSGAAYCKTHELVYPQFMYWRQKFCAPRDNAKTSTLPTQKGFAHVMMPEPSSGLSLSLPSGLVISGIDQSNVDIISELLVQL